jgi:hypothetical protein
MWGDSAKAEVLHNSLIHMLIADTGCPCTDDMAHLITVSLTLSQLRGIDLVVQARVSF